MNAGNAIDLTLLGEALVCCNRANESLYQFRIFTSVLDEGVADKEEWKALLSCVKEVEARVEAWRTEVTKLMLEAAQVSLKARAATESGSGGGDPANN